MIEKRCHKTYKVFSQLLTGWTFQLKEGRRGSKDNGGKAQINSVTIIPFVLQNITKVPKCYIFHKNKK